MSGNDRRLFLFINTLLGEYVERGEDEKLGEKIDNIIRAL